MNIEHRLLATNYSKGRVSAFPIDTVVIHVMEGTMAGTLSHFNSKAAQASAHYGISKTGAVVQYVDEKDTAWHSGRVDHPTAAVVLSRLGSNPNGWSIGIEHEGMGNTDLTEPQRAASADLLRDIASRHPGVVLDRQHVIGHHEIFSKKTCPGGISISKLLAEAKAETRDADPPRVVWSEYLNDYLIVTRYVSDSEWYHVPMKNAGNGTRASVRLTSMPLKP